MHKNRIRGFDPYDLYKNNPGFKIGDADLIVGGSTDQVISRTALFWLQAIFSRENTAPFTNITIVAPPILVWNRSDRDILQMIFNAVEEYRGTPTNLNEQENISSRISIVRCQGLSITDVTEAINGIESKQLLLFPKADKYKDSTIESNTILGRSSMLMSEDQWVPHLASLTRHCIEIAKLKESLMVFEVTESPPVKESNHKLLVDIEQLYPAFMLNEVEKDPNELILNNGHKWVAMAATERAEEAFAEINATTLDQSLKSQLIIQIANRSKNYELTERVIKEELAKGSKFPPEMAARFGCIAQRLGDTKSAELLLSPSIDHLSDQDLLESVLGACTVLNIPELVERTFKRLELLFPRSEFLRANCEQRLIHSCQRLDLSDQNPPSNVGFNESQIYLAEKLNSQIQDSYESLLKTVEEEWPENLELSVICCAIHAHANGNQASALSLAMLSANSEQYEYQAVNIILSTIRRMMLLEEVPKNEVEVYKLPLQFVIRYLANHPADARTRVLLTNLLAVDSCGSIGLPLIASLTLDIAQMGASIAPVVSNESLEVSEQTFMEFFGQSLAWLASQPIVEIGVTRLPAELVRENPKGLINYIKKLINYGINQKESHIDLHFLEQCAHLLCFLTPHVLNDTSDIEVLRILANRFWFDGQAQKARDYAEQMLELARNTPERQREAWASYADVYHRTRSLIDALVGVSCAFACNSQVTHYGLWQETYTLLRIARDINLNKIAMALVKPCRALLELNGMAKNGARRMDTIELGLRLSDINHRDIPAVSVLIIDLTNHCLELIKENDELLPATILLAQSIGLLERSGSKAEPRTRETLNTLLNNMSPRTIEYIRALSAAIPSVEDVININSRLDKARNSQDATGDLVGVFISARRLLQGCISLKNPEEAVVAAELLTEKALELPTGALELNKFWPAEFVKKLSTEGLAILMLSLNEKGDLITVIAENGTLEINSLEDQEKNFYQELQKWSANYPYDYGLIDREEGNNEFYLSMRQFEIPIPLSQKILVIAEPELQQIPLNLVIRGEEFAGKTHAIGYAPSLTWFEAARKNQVNHDGRRLAWVSASTIPENMGTLEMILERLRPTLDQHGFHTETCRQIPKNFIGAQMAVITAHGGLTTDRKFIHKISDEEALIESPITLARSLAQIELVILFVCSGGRIDSHPFGNTTVGLPKLLLNNGCRTIIASPWPLSAVVTGSWLERFMQAWEEGETALMATFYANQAVEERLGDPPQYSLAMTVYGDVLLKKC